MASQAGSFNVQEFADLGTPLVGGRLYTYSYGTTTQKTAYTDSAGTIPHTYTSDGAGGQYIALNSRGELPASLYLATGPYDLALKRADGSSVWTRRAEGPTDYTASPGSSLVGFIQAGTGAVLRTVQDKMRDLVNVKDYGVLGDGVTDDTAKIATANAAAVALGKTLFWPAGTYIASNIAALAGMRWIGEGVGKTTIKLKAGTNAALVTCASSNIDDVHIAHLTFDGNSAGNTAGDTLTIKGCRTSFVDIAVINSAGNGIVTDWNVANAARLTGCEGFFSHITIDSSQQSGWLHHGPSDSHFESVIIIDAGLKTNNTYYGAYLFAGPGNGRFFNVHVWNRDATTNVPTVGVYVESSGNNFAGCHFEGGVTCLSIVGAGNTFGACAAYAPRGTFSVNMTGSSNIVNLALGLTFATANPAYKGVSLTGSNNFLSLTNTGSGCTLGAIDFAGDSGENIVNVVGNQATGTPYVGTPNASDQVTVAVSGAVGVVFSQMPEVAWSTSAPVPTAQSGAFTTASASVRYRKMGKTVYLSCTVTITTNGTAAGSVSVTLPVQPKAGIQQCIPGRATSVSGKALIANMSGTTMNIFNYDNTYPGANGETLVMTGVYESV
jgi:hypothetical protein